jgi:hypothetical protein
MPFLPVVPVRKYCAVYNLRFDPFHGMEEVIGSIPIRSTNTFHLDSIARQAVEILQRLLSQSFSVNLESWNYSANCAGGTWRVWSEAKFQARE